METRYIILNELEGISPAVANIGNSKVYSVPADYFNTLPDYILSRIHIEAISRTVPFSQPPKNYFDELASHVLLKIKEHSIDVQSEESILKFSSTTGQDLQVPKGYFESFPDRMLAAVKALDKYNDVEVELLQLAPGLNTISRTNVYSIPEGYFEQFNANVKNILAPELKPAKIVPIYNRFKKVISIAAAAAIAGIIFFVQYQKSGNNETNPQVAENTQINYDQIKEIDISQELALLSVKDIQSYLDTQSVAHVEARPSLIQEAFDIERILDNASDDDIKMYLKQNAEPGENKLREI